MRPDRTLVQAWLKPLKQQTGLSEETLKDDGLSAMSFSPQTVCIDFEDRSMVRFRWAFFVADSDRPGCYAVFTEHCGYHEFLLSPEDRIFLA